MCTLRNKGNEPVAWRLPNHPGLSVALNNGSEAAANLLAGKCDGWFKDAVPLWYAETPPATPKPTLFGAVVRGADGKAYSLDSDGEWLCAGDSGWYDYGDIAQPVEVLFEGVK